MITVLMFLLEHADLIEALRDALKGGATREELLKTIRASQVAASDALMREELR